jgi:cytochrome c peroxidase
MARRKLVLGSVGAWLGGLAAAVAAAGPAEGGADAAPPEEPVVALGRRLFQDPAVSRTGRFACASCHDADRGWSDPRPRSDDEDGPTRRHSQTIADLRGTGFHWDGEFGAARDLIVARVGDPASAALAAARRAAVVEREDRRTGAFGGDFGGSYGGFEIPGTAVAAAPPVRPVAERLAADARYVPAFRAAFGDERITDARVVDAVDAFVRSVRTERNALDRHLAGEPAALPAPAARGLELFRGKASCATCHALDVGEDGRAALTDGKFHNTGVASAVTGQRKGGRIAFNGNHVGGGFDRGLAERTGLAQHEGAFKTPSLRDVTRSAPYMHDARFATLFEVVDYYDRGGTPNEHLDPAVKPLGLSGDEKRDLVAFLESLTAPRRAGWLPERAGPSRRRFRVVDPSGTPAAGLWVRVEPCGERLGSGPVQQPFPVQVTKDGELAFELPQTTHVRLVAGGVELAFGRPVPDVADGLELVAAPLERVVVVLRGETLPERLHAVVADHRLTTFGGELVEVRPCDTLRPATDSVGEPFRFDRVRTLRPGEAVYVALLGTQRDHRRLRFDLGGGRIAAATVDLAGGQSEPAELRPVRVLQVELGDAGPTLVDGAR